MQSPGLESHCRTRSVCVAFLASQDCSLQPQASKRGKEDIPGSHHVGKSPIIMSHLAEENARLASIEGDDRRIAPDLHA